MIVRIIKGIAGILLILFGLVLLILPWVIPPIDGATIIGGFIFGSIFTIGGLSVFYDGAILDRRVF